MIKHPLCNGCIKTYKNAQDIPMAILKMPGVASLFLEKTTTGMMDMGNNLELTNSALDIISSAQGYQAKASDPRLSKPSTARGAEGGLNRFKNLGKAQSVVAERKAKRAEATLVGIGIKVGATLWKIPEHGKMVKRFLGRLAPETMLKDKKIEIHFAFFENKVFRDGYQNSTESYHLPSHSKGSSALTNLNLKASSTVGSKTKKPRTDVTVTSAIPASSSRLQVSNSQPIRSSFTFAVPDIPHCVGGHVVLKSAFQPPTATHPKWTRDIEMITCSFLRTEVTYTLKNGLDVQFETSEIAEEMQIAAKWEKASDGGYIGEEYVLTQPIDTRMENSAVKSILQAEYALLCIGDTLKREYDEHACKSGIVSIPKFYFNFKGSILGSLVPSLSSHSRSLPHSLFIATPLLPCGELDGKIKKFTGNDEFGDADDHLTKAIHAFSHFTAVYTQKNIILCDLQGMFDRDKVMCLIDPQGHTATRDNSCHEYWDGVKLTRCHHGGKRYISQPSKDKLQKRKRHGSISFMVNED
ncbi:hypothetical protein BYT27DRAFT_7208146 [Phlegmacium glaucopus]|nr:hypothetical protein BYT27DRAFT_7208146 [Phlegmacium glaucopus]